MADNIVTKLKRMGLLIAGRITWFRKEVKCDCVWYGNEYGGFYVNPGLLSEQSVVYSFGIGEDVSFDKAILDKHHCQVFGFDPTPKSILWINQQLMSKYFHFSGYGLSRESGMAQFCLPVNQNHVSGSLVKHQQVDQANMVSVPMKSFTDITSELGHRHIDVLKMDIEGSEYDVLESVLNAGVTIDQILIEFHERFFDDGKSRTQNILTLLAQRGYRIFGVSGTYEEVSFIHADALNVRR